MSYARMNDDSDVYVYSGGGVLHCQWCKLGRDDFSGDRAAMLAHLDAHKSAGHRVPEAAIERIKGELSGELLTAEQEIEMFQNGTHPDLPWFMRRGEN